MLGIGMYRFKKTKHRTIWNGVRKKAPKVPDITCPDIDEVLKLVLDSFDDNKVLKRVHRNKIVRTMERLRTSNEKLRDSGVYWHDTAKELCKKYID
tara:strand:- start:612 stop:899 length:288 start_codon:yes stop_codon:yes gene_type:complete